MTEAYDWAASRGEKWRAQLTGMEGTLAPVDAPLLRALRLEASTRIAEVGCGGGGTALEILRQAPAGSVVHGFDISPALVEVARARVPAGERRIAFDVADVARTTPETPYERLVSRFGVMFFDDAPAAFTNLARWLAPGGRFAFAVWGPTPDNPWMTTVRDAVARIVEVPRSDPSAPGPFRYADPRVLLALLEMAGLSELDVLDWRGALPIGGGRSPAEAARFALSALASFAELLAGAREDALEEAHRALTTTFAEHVEGGTVRMGARVHLVSGVRPRA